MLSVKLICAAMLQVSLHMMCFAASQPQAHTVHMSEEHRPIQQGTSSMCICLIPVDTDDLHDSTQPHAQKLCT